MGATAVWVPPPLNRARAKVKRARVRAPNMIQMYLNHVGLRREK